MLLIKIIKKFSGGLRPFKLDVNFTIPSGIPHAVFFGPSGSGKTLTMQCVAGLARPDAGRIVVGDDVFFDSEQKICLHPQKRSVGYMPQDYALFPHLNILQNVAYSRTGLFGRRVSALEKARALEIMERFGLGGLGKHLPREISGGQKQRASLARAINSSPRLLLLDEPFSALDPLLREQARQEALGFIRNFDIPAIIITHDPADVDAFAGLLVLYKNGHAKTVENYQYLRATFDNAADCLRHLESMFPESAASGHP